MSDKRRAEVIALDKSEQRKVSKDTKKLKKAIESGEISVKEKKRDTALKGTQNRGLIYIGHIPHGFYEKEMKEYFKQFGKVTNVKVCRSRTTGNSKGFGYIEFAHPEVAKVAADTMNNYVMFKKRIITEFVPFENRPKGLFFGKSSSKEHTSVKTRRGKQKYSKNKIVDERKVIKQQKKTLRKVSTRIQKLNQLGINCNVQPVGIDSKSLTQLEVQIKKKVEADEDSEVEFRKPSAKPNKLQPLPSDKFKNSSTKSLGNEKSSKTILTKSLDSVKKLISKKNTSSTKTIETQTTLQKNKNKTVKGGITKKDKKQVPLNNKAVKVIARELIRKRGNPLINLLPRKPFKVGKKK